MVTAIAQSNQFLRSSVKRVVYKYPVLSHLLFTRGLRIRTRIAFENGDYARVLELMQVGPLSNQITTEQIESLIGLGELDKAESKLEALKAKNRLGRNLSLRLADIYMASKRYKEAEEVITKAIFAAPSHFAPRCKYAEILFDTGDAQRANEILFSVMKQHPGRPEPIWVLAEHLATPADFAKLYDFWMQNIKSGKALYSTCLSMAYAARQVEEYDKAKLITSAAIKHMIRRPPPVIKSKTLRGGVGNVALLDLKEELDKHNIPFYLVSGTLLGAVREGRTLEFDKDIDVAIFDDVDRTKVENAIAQSRKFKLKETHKDSEKIWLSHYNGTVIDIFIEHRTPTEYYHFGAFAKWSYSPFGLKPMKLLGKQFLIPDNPERYLAENYGEGWRIPDPTYDALYEAPNITIFNKDYLDTHVYRQILKAIRAQKFTVLRKYLTDFRELLQNEAWYDEALELCR